MSQSLNSPTDRQAIAPFVAVAAALAVGFALLVWIGSGSDTRKIENSPLGSKALASWLTDQGLPARTAHPRIHPAVETLSLRLLPILDSNLAVNTWDHEDEPLAKRQTLRDIQSDDYLTKLQELPTIVILPKWNGALVQTGIAHSQSLAPLTAGTSQTNALKIPGTRLQRGGAVFSTQTLRTGETLALFHAQTFEPNSLPRSCTSQLTFGEGVLIMSCQIEAIEHPTLFVADPDLLNNHGLSVGDNAAFVILWLRDLLGDDTRTVYVDTSSDLLTSIDRDDERQDYERGAEEFSAFFKYPFTVFWASLLILIAVLYWRGAKRFGPLLAPQGMGRERSKRTAIAAKARLLRLSGNDGRMVSDFVREQMQDLAQASFGQDLGPQATTRFFALIARRDSELAARLQTVSDLLIQDGPTLPPAQLHRHLATYHSLLTDVMENHGPV